MKRPFGLHPVLLFVLCMAIILGGFSYLYLDVINPLSSKVSVIQSQISQTESQLLIKKAQIKSASQIDVNPLLLALPSDEEFGQYLMRVSAQASSSQCTIQSFGPSQSGPTQGAPIGQPAQPSNGAKNPASSSNGSAPSSGSSGLQSVSYDLTGTAPNFDAMKTFLHSMEHLNRLTYVDALHFTGGSGGPVSFSLTVTIFYDPNLKDLGPSNQDLPYVSPAHKTSPF